MVPRRVGTSTAIHSPKRRRGQRRGIDDDDDQDDKETEIVGFGKGPPWERLAGSAAAEGTGAVGVENEVRRPWFDRGKTMQQNWKWCLWATRRPKEADWPLSSDRCRFERNHCRESDSGRERTRPVPPESASKPIPWAFCCCCSNGDVFGEHGVVLVVFVLGDDWRWWW